MSTIVRQLPITVDFSHLEARRGALLDAIAQQVGVPSSEEEIAGRRQSEAGIRILVAMLRGVPGQRRVVAAQIVAPDQLSRLRFLVPCRKPDVPRVPGLVGVLVISVVDTADVERAPVAFRIEDQGFMHPYILFRLHEVGASGCIATAVRSVPDPRQVGHAYKDLSCRPIIVIARDACA